MRKIIAIFLSLFIISFISNPATADKLASAKVSSEVCKIKEDSSLRGTGLGLDGRYTGNATAFPFNPTSLPVMGQINTVMIFVDWPDLPGNQKDYTYFNQQMKMFSDFYASMSGNKLEMRISSSKTWLRIPGSYKTFVTTAEDEAQRGDAPKKQAFYDAAVSASDPSIDFSKYDIVFFAVPRAKKVFANGPHEFNFDHNAQLNTQEKTIFDTATAGDFFLQNPGQPPWVYYVHETGHMIGIPHQADETQNKPNTEKYLANPFGGYDIMSNQGGGSRTISAWLRWLAGWFVDSQVVCLEKQKVVDETVTLTPINFQNNGVKLAAVRLSETKLLVAESRRFDKKFDIATGNSKNGVLVYTVDATKSSAQGSQVLLSPRNIKKYLKEKNTFPDWRELDVTLFKGNFVRYENILIRVQNVGANTDVIRISSVK